MESVISKEMNACVTVTAKKVISVASMAAKKTVLKFQVKNMVKLLICFPSTHRVVLSVREYRELWCGVV